MWRPHDRCAAPRPRSHDMRGGAPWSSALVTVAQRRALRPVRAGRLSAAVRAPTAAPVAPRTAAVWKKALSLFSSAEPGLDPAPSVEAAFRAALSAATNFKRVSSGPRVLPREAAADAIRRAPHGSAPGPSGLHMEHLRALGDAGQTLQAGVVCLLASEAAALFILPVAAHAFAGADLLLLCEPGGVDAKGYPPAVSDWDARGVEKTGGYCPRSHCER